MARLQTTLGIPHALVRLLLCACAPHEGDQQLPVCRDRRVIPHGTGFLAGIISTVLLFFFDKTPLVVARQGAWSQVMHLVIVEALRMTPTDCEQTRHGFFGNLRAPRGRADAPSFLEMVNDIDRLRLTECGVEQGGAASCGPCILAAATAQETDAVTAIHLAGDQIMLARLALGLACRIDAGSSGEVRGRVVPRRSP
jgi:hypothetical protein